MKLTAYAWTAPAARGTSTSQGRDHGGFFPPSGMGADGAHDEAARRRQPVGYADSRYLHGQREGWQLNPLDEARPLLALAPRPHAPNAWPPGLLPHWIWRAARGAATRKSPLHIPSRPSEFRAASPSRLSESLLRAAFPSRFCALAHSTAVGE
jgi:hypothetical protein